MLWLGRNQIRLCPKLGTPGDRIRGRGRVDVTFKRVIKEFTDETVRMY